MKNAGKLITTLLSKKSCGNDIFSNGRTEQVKNTRSEEWDEGLDRCFSQ